MGIRRCAYYTTYGIYKYTMLELLIASLTTLSNSASSKSYNKEGHTSEQRCTWRLAHCHSHARRQTSRQTRPRVDTNVGGFVSTSPLAVSTPARTSLAVGSLSHAKHTRRLRAQLLYTGGTPQLLPVYCPRGPLVMQYMHCMYSAGNNNQ